MSLPRALTTAPAEGATPADRTSLDYAGRFLRRKRLTTEGGEAILVDLAQTTDLTEAMVLVLDDGRQIAILAASEPLLRVTGPELARLAWHIGNRHTPCQVEADHLLIRQDHVLAGMLAGLGAEVTEVTGPFRPEGGAYGQGRTMGHAHGPDGQDGHGHDHSHPHSHAHTHDH